MSFQWLSVFAAIYFASSLLMSACESYLMSQGIVSYWSDLGPIHGVRIGLSVIFVCTGVTCLIMVKRVQKRSTTLATLFLALSSLISGNFLFTDFK